LENNTDAPSANLRAAGYYIARSSAACPHCGTATGVTALAVAPGHETRDDESDDWLPVAANAFCFHVAAVSPAVCRRLLEEASNFRLVASETGSAHWANHCEHCGSELSDDELHCEPGAHGFVPCSEAQASGITLVEVPEPFEASVGGVALEPEFFEFMRRA
jgi:hypothetical protein